MCVSFTVTETEDECSDFEDYDDKDTTGGLPQKLKEDCAKLKKDPNHDHKGYLSFQTLLDICHGNKEHEHAGLIKNVGEEKWTKTADSVVMLRVSKETKRKRRPRERFDYFSTGFVVDYWVPEEGCCAIITANHNILKDKTVAKSYSETVQPSDISVVFFHDGLNKEVTCDVTSIAPMRSPPTPPNENHDPQRLDYAVLFVEVNEKVKELKKEVSKITDERQKKIIEKQIQSLSNLTAFYPDSSIQLQMMEMSCAMPYIRGLVLVCIGHPGGAPTQISFGSIQSKPKKLYNVLHPKRRQTAFIHTCTTCQGSSGSPIFAFLNSTDLSVMAGLYHRSDEFFSIHVKGVTDVKTGTNQNWATSTQSIDPDVIKKTPEKSNDHLIFRRLTRNCDVILSCIISFHFQVPREDWLYIWKCLDKLEKDFESLERNDLSNNFSGNFLRIELLMTYLFKPNKNPPMQGDDFMISPLPFEEIPGILKQLQEAAAHDLSGRKKQDVWGFYPGFYILMLLNSWFYNEQSRLIIQTDGILVLLELLSDADLMFPTLALLHAMVNNNFCMTKTIPISQFGLREKISHILNSPPTQEIFWLALNTLLLLYPDNKNKCEEILSCEVVREMINCLSSRDKSLPVLENITSILLNQIFPTHSVNHITRYICLDDVGRLTRALQCHAHNLRVQLCILMILYQVYLRSNEHRQAAVDADTILVLAKILEGKTYIYTSTPRPEKWSRKEAKEHTIKPIENLLQIHACLLAALLTPEILSAHLLQPVFLESKLLESLVYMLDNGKDFIASTTKITRLSIHGPIGPLYFPAPMYIRMYKDGIIMKTIIKLVKAARYLSTFRQVTNVLKTARFRDKISNILLNGDAVHRLVALELCKCLVSTAYDAYLNH